MNVCRHRGMRVVNDGWEFGGLVGLSSVAPVCKLDHSTHEAVTLEKVMPATDDAAAMALVDVERYPVHDLSTVAGQQLVAQCRQDLAARALCSLPGFLRPEAIQKLVDEARPLVPEAVFTDTLRTIFFGPAQGADFPPDHPRNMEFLNRYARIVNHQFANEGLSRALFLWPAMTEFVRQVFGAATMYPTQCPHLALTMKIEGEGDTDAWHYDGNDGVVSLGLQMPDEGGLFEYAPYIRKHDDENIEGVSNVLKDPEQHALRPPLEPGTLVFFNGDLSLHRVTPVGKTTKPRMILLLSFDRTPNFVFPNRAAERIRTLPKVKDLAVQRSKYLVGGEWR